MPLREAQRVLQTLRDLDLAGATMNLYLAATDGEELRPRFAHVQITNDVADEFREVFRTVRSRLDDDVVLRAYTPGSKPDEHEIEYVALDRVPEIANQLAPFQERLRIPVFLAEPEFVEQLRFYTLALQDGRAAPVYGFRIYTRQKELSHSRLFGLSFVRGQFNRIHDPLFLFDQYLDCISHEGTMLVLKQDNFQKLFRYYEMLQRTAAATLGNIQERIPIANFADFEAACQGHLQKLSKLKNIAQRPYWNRITMRELKRAIKRYDLPIEVTRQNGTEMLVYDPSDRWAILRLLDDDYLESVMTEEAYEVTGKRVHQRPRGD